MAECRSCKREVEWAVTAKNGKRVPLDPGDADLDGAGVLVIVREGTRDMAYSRKEALNAIALRHSVSTARARELLDESDVRVRISHFSTCPDADKFRR
jgi:hypothetical protein